MERVLELDNRHLVIIKVIITSHKHHQQMLNVGGNFSSEQNIYIVLKYLLTDCLLVTGEKLVTILCQGQHLDQMIKVNITNEGQIDIVYLLM